MPELAHFPTVSDFTYWIGIAAVAVFAVIGVFGGALSDIFCAEIPLVFLPGELYASAAWAGALALVGLRQAGVDEVTAGWIGMVVVLALRLVAMRLRLRLPPFRVRK